MKDWLKNLRIGIAVAKTITSGKPSKYLDKIEKGTEIADKAFEIKDLVKDLVKKKKK